MNPPVTSPTPETVASSEQMKQAITDFTGHAAEVGPEVTCQLRMDNLNLRHALLEKEKMQAILLSTLQSQTTGVLAVGQDGIVIVANPTACQILERPLQAIAGSPVECVLSAAPGAQDLLQVLQGARGGSAVSHWHQGRNKTGPRHIELAAVRALPPHDQHLGGLVLLEDRTELKRLEHQATLQTRLTAMGSIATNLAHEIRNPLGSIALFASTLERELADEPSLEALARQIVSGVKSLEHLVSNTLEFARPRRMAIARVNLTEIIGEALVYIEHPVQQKSIQVVFDPQLHPRAWVTGDAEQLKQVFLNLLLNGIQAVEQHGRLAVELSPTSSGGWRVSLQDDGIGIPEELQDRIFDPFYSTREKGSGIGLAIVHKILSAHQATIELESVVPVGTSFRIEFPAERAFQI